MPLPFADIVNELICWMPSKPCKNFATNNITYITDCKSATFQGKKMPSKLWVLGSNPNRIT